MVCKTVILEFEWVMRGYYGFNHAEVISVLRHLMALPHISIEDRSTVERALSQCDAGLELADALHHASYVIAAAWFPSMTKNLRDAPESWD